MFEKKNFITKKENFDKFFVWYFFVILIISLLSYLLGWNSGLIIFGRILFVILFFIEYSVTIILWIKKGLNRTTRKVSNYTHKYGGIPDSMSDSSIIIQYNAPKGISSAEAGLLLHRYASSIDMFSLLYFWSSKKYITIECMDGYDGNELIILKKLKDIPYDAPIYQSVFFNELFFGSVNERCLTEISEIDHCYNLFDLEKYGISKGWFESSNLNFLRFNSGGKFLFFCGLFVFFLFGSLVAICFILLFYICERVFKYFYRLKRTQEGDKLVEHLLGFRKFVLSCDENKLQSLLKEDPLYYDEVLSYAVVFGIETDLLKKLIPVFDKDIDPGDGTYGRWNKLGKFKKLT